MLLSNERIREIFAEVNAIITDGHFVYSKKPDGWYHGYEYVNKDAIYLYPGYVSDLCVKIAWHFVDSGVQVVVGPTVGGAILAQWIPYWLSSFVEEPREILAVCADEEDVLEQRDTVLGFGEKFLVNGIVKVECQSGFGFLGHLFKAQFPSKVGTRRVIKRGYDVHIKGKQCLIVEDVINSGATVAKTAEAITIAGGNIVGVGALCNRSGGKVNAQTLGVPELFSLIDLDMQMFREEDCPICKERGIKSVRTDLGKGKEFLARMGKS